MNARLALGGGTTAQAPFRRIDTGNSVVCGGCGIVLNWPSRIGRHHVDCPSCRRHLSLPNSRRVTCPSCQAIVPCPGAPRNGTIHCAACDSHFEPDPPTARIVHHHHRHLRSEKRTKAVSLIFTLGGLLVLTWLCLVAYLL